jgi:hypothetical protein
LEVEFPCLEEVLPGLVSLEVELLGLEEVLPGLVSLKVELQLLLVVSKEKGEVEAHR